MKLSSIGHYVASLCLVIAIADVICFAQSGNIPMRSLQGVVHSTPNDLNNTHLVRNALVQCFGDRLPSCVDKSDPAQAITTNDKGAFAISVPVEVAEIYFVVRSDDGHGHLTQIGDAFFELPPGKDLEIAYPKVTLRPMQTSSGRGSLGQPESNVLPIVLASFSLGSSSPDADGANQSTAPERKTTGEQKQLRVCLTSESKIDALGATLTVTSVMTNKAMRLPIGADGCFTTSIVADGTDYLLSAYAAGYQPRVLVFRLEGDTILSGDPGDEAGQQQEIERLSGLSIKIDATKDSAAPDGRIDSLVIARGAALSADFALTLPLSGWRSPDQLAFLLPGIAPPPQPVGLIVPGVAPGIGSAGQFSANGLRGRDNTFTNDGSDNNDEETGVRRQGIIAPFPQPIESIQEVRLATSLADSSYGRGIASQMDVFSLVPKTSYHGQIWGVAAGSPFRARDPFDVGLKAYPPGQQQYQIPITSNGLLPGAPGASTVDLLSDAGSMPGVQPNPAAQREHLTRVQTGFLLGGRVPSKLGRLFSESTGFTVSYERNIVHQTRKLNFDTPTPDQRQVCPPSNGASRPAAMDSCIPGSVMSPDLFGDSLRGDALWSLYPFPNNPYGPYGGNTFTAALPADGAANLYAARFDKNFDRLALRNLFTARYNASEESSVLPATGDSISSSVQPIIRTRNAAIILHSALRGVFSNAARASYGLTGSHFSDPDPAHAGDAFMLNRPLLLNVTLPGSPSPQLEIANSADGRVLVSAACKEFLQGCGAPSSTNQVDAANLGGISVGGFSSVGVVGSNFPEARKNSTLQFADSATLLLGSHLLSMGVDIRRLRLNDTTGPSRPLANYNGVLNVGTCQYPSCQPVTVVGQNIQVPTGLASSGILTAAQVVSTGLKGQSQTYAIVPVTNPSTAPNYTLNLGTVQADFFVQDQFAPFPGLHLSVGLRIQDQPIPGNKGYFSQAFNGTFYGQSVIPSSGCATTPLVQLLCSLLPASAQNQSLNSFALEKPLNSYSIGLDPRLGVVWSPASDGRLTFRAGGGRYTGQFPAVLVDEARNIFPNFVSIRGATLAGSIISLPADEPFYQALTSAVKDIGTNSLAMNLVYPGYPLKNPYSIQQLLTAEYRPATSILITAAYVGSEGRQLLMASTPLGGLDRSWFNTAMGVNGHFLGPIGCTSFAQIPTGGVNQCVASGKLGVDVNSLQFGSGANSSYNSLQATTEWRWRGWIRFGSAFTWSHAIDNVSDFAPLAGAFALPQDSFRSSERGPSNFDVRFRSSTDFVADGSGLFPKNAWLNNWKLSGVLTLQSGQPYTINTSVDVNMDGNATDRLGNTNAEYLIPSTGPRTKYLLNIPQGMTTAVLLASPGQDGAVGRNTFVGWGLYNFDLALSRSFPLKRPGLRFELRGELFNVFNHPDFGIPDRILESSAFGKAVSTVAPQRMAQAQLRFLF